MEVKAGGVRHKRRWMDRVRGVIKEKGLLGEVYNRAILRRIDKSGNKKKRIIDKPCR